MFYGKYQIAGLYSQRWGIHQPVGFWRKTIQSIIARLTEAGADIIEIGFLRNCTWDKDKTVFSSIRELKKLLPMNPGRPGLRRWLFTISMM